MKRSFSERLLGGATEETAKSPVTIGEKISYAAGDFGCNMTFAVFTSSLFTFFWQDGRSNHFAAIISILLIVTKIWDAIVDTTIGGLIDNVKVKIGHSKFKPWMLAGAFLVTIAAPFCWLPMAGKPEVAQISVFAVTYILWNTCYSIINIPYGSIVSVMTIDPLERQSLSTYRSVGTIIANIMMQILFPLLIAKDNKPQDYAIWVVMTFAIIGLISYLILILGVKERLVLPPKQKEKGAYFKALGGFFTNRAALFLTLTSIIQLLIVLGVQGYTLMNIIRIVSANAGFNIGTTVSGIVSAISWLPSLFIAPFIKKLVKKFGKKEVTALPLLFGILSGVILLILPLENYHPITTIAILSVVTLINGLGTVTLSMTTWAMIADCIDYQEYKTGRRAEGVVYATYSLGRKLSQALSSGGVPLLVVALCNYDNELGPQNTLTVAGNLRLLLAICYIVGFGLMFIVMLFGYNLNKKKLEEIEVTLKERRQLEMEKKNNQEQQQTQA